jgi:hypothetical protein
MITDTPRTDAAAVFPASNDDSDNPSPFGTHVDADLARELERELALKEADIRRLDAHLTIVENENNLLIRENAKLRDAFRLAIHVRGTTDDTVEVLQVMEAALLPNR